MDLMRVKNQLWQRRQDIVALWQASLTEFDHTYPSSLNQFTKLVEDFIIVLFETPVNIEKAYTLGANFAQIHHIHADVLTKTQTILLLELTADLCSEDLKAVQPRLIQIYNHFFVGYYDFAYTKLLDRQAKESKQLVIEKEQITLFTIQQEESWFFLVEQVSNPIIFHDGMYILGANAAAHTMSGTLSPPLTGTPILALFAPWAQKPLELLLQTTILAKYETAVSSLQDMPFSVSIQNISLRYQQQDAYALIIHTSISENQQANSPKDSSPLTDREIEILQLMATDHNDSTIAERLGIESTTVKFHLQNTRKKLNVFSRAAAIHKAWQHGLLAK